MGQSQVRLILTEEKEENYMEKKKFNWDLLRTRKFTEDDAEEVAALIQRNF